jgi:hypothetical protein
MTERQERTTNRIDTSRSTTAPTAEILRAYLSDRGVALEEDRLLEALEAHAKYRWELDMLRSARFEYGPFVVEPGTAEAWIRRGGRSID